jgi:hypothetical protein
MFLPVAVRTAVRAATIAVLATAALVVASPAAAQTATGRLLSVDVGTHGVDVAAFRQLVAVRFHVRVERIVASDIDRDGDLDIIAAGARGLTIWLNDGFGHLEQQRPRHAPIVSGEPGDGTWSHRDDRRDESLQDGSPSVWIFGIRAHDPPASPPGRARAFSNTSHTILEFRSAGPRAPPA